MGKGSGGGSGSTTPRIADGATLPSARRISHLRFDALGGPLPCPRRNSKRGSGTSTTVAGVVISASLGHATPRGGSMEPCVQGCFESGQSTPIPRASSSSSCATSSNDSVDLSSLDLTAAPLSSDITAVHSPAESPDIAPSHPPQLQWGDQMQSAPALQACEDQSCEDQTGLSGIRRRKAPPETPEVCEISEECPTVAQEQASQQGQCLVINGTVLDGKAGLPAEAITNYGALVRFMGDNHKNLAIVVQCLTVMGSSATSPANRVKCFRAGCADAVVKCLREHKDQSLVQEYGLWVLSMLSYDRRISMMVASLDGIKMACKAMKAFPKVETLQQRAGWFLLVQLSWRHPAVLQSMEKRGVPQLLSDAQCNFADCKLLEQVRVDCMAMLQGKQVAQPLFALDRDAAAPVHRRRQGAFF